MSDRHPPQRHPPGRGGRGTENAPSGEPDRPRITMDYYHRTRRKRPPSWPYALAALLMLAILVGIVVLQDRCGAGVSEAILGG